ncbi:MAG: bifunctional riboflavin kinase/FAD synthetase [Flavobacterium sp.]|nr:bifunctional riboflavin kinase/FAD synthetase [Flavobacterium sp.]
MKLFASIDEFKSEKKSVLTLGTFDGVHIGHKKIIDRLIQSAADEQCESVVLTFFPHPRMVLQDAAEILLLNTIDERADLLEKSGLDSLIVHPFDKAFSRLTAEEFIRVILVDKLQIHKIIIGYDHRFGRNRTANIDDLVEFGNQYGFEVEQISAKELDDVSVSSTKIRRALQNGDVALATAYLGYDYPLTGTVVEGRKLGRTLGYPTANIRIPENYKLIPKDGVYVVKSTIDGRQIGGMMNIGINPTIEDANRSIEIYFIDFDADLYGRELQVSLLHRLRDEQKFESLDLLKQQLAEDELQSRAFLNSVL